MTDPLHIPQELIDNPITIKGKPIDAKQVAILANNGCSQRLIGSLLGFEPVSFMSAIQRNPALHACIKENTDNLKKRLLCKQVELAEQGDKTMLVWLGKNLLQQTDQHAHNIKAEGLNINITMQPFVIEECVQDDDSNDT